MLRVPLPAEQPRFGIAFRHSVETSPVIEWFEPAGTPSTGLLLVATEYESFGAGLPAEPPPGARFVELPDRFLMDGLAVPVPDLVLRPLPLTQHALLVGDVRLDLTGLVAPGAALRVRVRWAGEKSGP